jgi:hypothetical protein
VVGFLLFLNRVKTEAKLFRMFHPEGDKKGPAFCREHFPRDMIAVVPLIRRIKRHGRWIKRRHRAAGTPENSGRTRTGGAA